jgi:hypothetical protein
MKNNSKKNINLKYDAATLQAGHSGSYQVLLRVFIDEHFHVITKILVLYIYTLVVYQV